MTQPDTARPTVDAAGMFDLGGRIAVVTGASRGIGAALAIGLANAGCDVAITARSATDLDATAEAIRAKGRSALPIAMDVRDSGAIASAVAKVVAALGAPDILINNAGVEDVRASTEVDDELWDRIVDTNLRGAFFCAREVGRVMLARQRGSIINMCSLASGIGIPTATPYGASKTGLLGVTRALSTEWLPGGVRVNAIAPGYFRTAMTEGFYRNPDWQASMLAKIPAHRFGNLEDLIGSAIFLASDASLYVSGQVIYVDGGYMASV
ncbi:SDR family oxidoreductase [Fodinicurvata sp. EGI_FJ10296]|uniref:SDR family NAD(P)-dependent oxidoreductase n=1 Tax=Fodinicurvata sp. EGI_FJ10296 TaxID=3231908 RepID=UPI0034513943